jgi:hypothetical protein
VIKRILIFFLIPLIISSVGCGLLYNNTVRPHSTDFNQTPIGTKESSHSAFKITLPLLPLSTNRVQAQWDVSEIRTLAKEAGLTEIYYTDLKSIEFLLGTFRWQTIILYGD